jgi:hypothetical protein
MRGATRELGAELERRAHRRVQPESDCEVFLGARRYDGRIEDVSRGGLFVRIDLDAQPGSVVRVHWEGQVRFAKVVHQRCVPRSLRWAISGGLGLRWIRLD